MLGSRGTERRENVVGEGQKAPSTRGWDKPPAVVGKRPLVATDELGPPSFEINSY